jgi:hypothetical protein
LITGKWGNNVIGFWHDAVDFVWLNKKLIPDSNINYNLNDDTLKLYSLISEKAFFIVNKPSIKWTEISRYLYFDEHFSNKKIFQDNYDEEGQLKLNFSNIVLGKPVSMSKENGIGYIYECICFDRVLNLDETNKIVTFLKKYYS